LKNTAMKASNHFSKIIKEQLDIYALYDEQLKNALLNPDKTLDLCIAYILTTVQKSGINGFTDDEVFQMAIEYYKTENVEITNPKISSQVVINRIPEITEEEKQAAKEQAFKELVFEEKTKLRTKQNNNKPADDNKILTLF